MTDDFNIMGVAYEKLKRLQEIRVVVGVPYNDKFLNMIGMVQETGADIKPVHGQYLVIPTKEANGKKTSEIDGLFKAGHVLAVKDASQPHGMKVMFILKKEVHIPPRPWLRFTWDQHGQEWAELTRDLVYRLITEENFPVEEVYNKLGAQAVKDVKQSIKDFFDPPNAGLTIHNKGRDDPLMDKGDLLDAITWYPERRP